AYSATGVRAALEEKKKPNRLRPSATLLALANPDFGGEQRFGTTARTTAEGERPLDNSSRSLYLGERGQGLTPLPGTQQEVEAIARLYPGATVMTQKQA